MAAAKDMGEPGPYTPPKPKPQPKKDRKVTAVDAPKRFRLLEPAEFTASKFDGAPTADEKKQIQWFVRDDATGEDLLEGSSALHPDGATLKIDAVPVEWQGRTIAVGADFKAPPKTPQVTAKPDSCTLYEWFALIRKAEAAYPSLSGVQMTDAMRRLAGVEQGFFLDLYGLTTRAQHLTPTGALTKADIDRLQDLMWHKDSSAVSSEVGIVADLDGTALAPAHVLTGLSAGVYRNTGARVNIKGVNVGDPVDNLYATTIAGDLGQVAVRVFDGKQPLPYLGWPGDASDAELVADIDGFLIGDAETRGGSGKKLSETLIAYYGTPATATNRYKAFRSKALTNLKDETRRFATNYKYADMGVKAPFADQADLDKHVGKAVDAFLGWLGKKP